MTKSIAERTIESATWNIGASFIGVVVLFFRSVMLSRLLPVAVFGVYGFATALVSLAGVALYFGMTGAFLHRAPETENEAHAAATHFTLTMLITLIWTIGMMAWTLGFTTGSTRLALIVLIITLALAQLAQTPRVILMRRVAHKRLAIIQFVTAISTTAAALALAWRGVALWALLITNVVTTIVLLAFMYAWKPVWRPRFRWNSSEIRYFLSFGARTFISTVLLTALDRIDDLWTGVYLGSTPLGYYSRAYTFASYPRRILATPINTVTAGAYAELKQERRHLSQTFFRTTALLLRTGFFAGGLFALIAPEFILLLLGEKWLPMTNVFRLMLIFTLLNPIKDTVANLFIAVGRPDQVIRARLVQLVVLVAGLFGLGLAWGLIGVAVAVDVMLLTGIAILLWKARVYVDLSVPRLFAAPTAALLAALLLSYGTLVIFGLSETSLSSALLKGSVFTAAYLLLMLAMEREQTLIMLKRILSVVRG